MPGAMVTLSFTLVSSLSCVGDGMKHLRCTRATSLRRPLLRTSEHLHALLVVCFVKRNLVGPGPLHVKGLDVGPEHRTGLGHTDQRRVTAGMG